MHILKKACSGVALALSLMLSGTALAQTASGVQTFRLENGLSVLIKEDRRFPLVSVRLFVKAGSAWERPEEAGISHLLEHMVFKGSKTSGPGVDKRVENAGGSMNAYTSYDLTTYLTDLPASRWKEAMSAVRDLAFDPLLKQEDLDAEREVVLAEKKQRGDSPMTRLFHTALGHTLKGTPYEVPVIGTEEALRGITADMMRDYISRRYDPRDMVLSVVGDVQAEAVLAEARHLFGGYANRNVLRVEPDVDVDALARGLVLDVQSGPWNKAFVSLSFPLPGMKEPLLPAVDVLSGLLAGDDTALLPRELRIEAQLVDDVNASAMNFERAGAFIILAQLDAPQADAYLRDICARLAALKASDFTDEQIARVKMNIEDSYLRGLENVADIAETMGSEYFYDPAGVGGLRYLAAVRSVDREDIQNAIDRWLRPDALTVAALMPQDGEGRAVVDEAAVRKAVTEAWPETAKPKADDAVASGTADAGGREVIDLGEGRRLVLLPDRSLPYVSATLAFSGGELLVPDGKEGLAALTASVLTAGTEGRDLHGINVYLSERASGLSASSGLRQFTVRMDAPVRFAPEVFALMKEVLEGPAFRKEDVERARREQIAAIASREESAMGLLGRQLRHFLFQKGAYAHRSEGVAETVATFGPEDVAAFWDVQKTRPWVLSVAGDLSREEIERFAASLPKPTDVALKTTAPSWNTERELSLTLPGRNQAVYVMLFPTVSVESEDRPALRLLGEALSGFTGKLYQELRERQSLGYSVFPLDWADDEAGFLAFGIVAAPENLDKARESFLRIVEELKADLLPEETLDRAKAVAEADYHRAQQSRSRRAAAGAASILHDRGLDYGVRKLELMKAATAEQVRDVARRYLHPESAYELSVRP